MAVSHQYSDCIHPPKWLEEDLLVLFEVHETEVCHDLPEAPLDALTNGTHALIEKCFLLREIYACQSNK